MIGTIRENVFFYCNPPLARHKSVYISWEMIHLIVLRASGVFPLVLSVFSPPLDFPQSI